MNYPKVLHRIIYARLLVGALGERLRWWPSEFTTLVGQRHLQLVLPRSWKRAALESVTLAARAHHDQSVPTDAVHLFRLGTAHEDAIAHELAAEALDLKMPPEPLGEVLAALNGFGAAASVRVHPGPLDLGLPSRLREHATIDELAGAYAWAAAEQAQTIPYFRARGDA